MRRAGLHRGLQLLLGSGPIPQSHGRLAFPVRMPQAARTREHSKIDGHGDRALGPDSAEDHPQRRDTQPGPACSRW